MKWIVNAFIVLCFSPNMLDDLCNMKTIANRNKTAWGVGSFDKRVPNDCE